MYKELEIEIEIEIEIENSCFNRCIKQERKGIFDEG